MAIFFFFFFFFFSSVLTDADAAYNFLVYSVSFRFKQKITGATGAQKY